MYLQSFCKLIKKQCTLYYQIIHYSELNWNPLVHVLTCKAFAWAGALTSRSTVKHAELRTIFIARASYDAKN